MWLSVKALGSNPNMQKKTKPTIQHYYIYTCSQMDILTLHRHRNLTHAVDRVSLV